MPANRLTGTREWLIVPRGSIDTFEALLALEEWLGFAPGARYQLRIRTLLPNSALCRRRVYAVAREHGNVHRLLGARSVRWTKFSPSGDGALLTADAAGLFGCGRERRVQSLHELDQIGLPQLGIEMAEMTVGAGSGRDQYITTMLDPRHRALDGAESRRIGVILRVVDQQHLGLDLVEIRLGVVSWIASIARSSASSAANSIL
jgi:hypothetical protein